MNRKGEFLETNVFIRDGDVFDTEKVGENYFVLDFIIENEKILEIPFYKRIRLFLSIKTYSKSNLLPKLFLDFKKENEKVLEKERKKWKQPFEGYIFTTKTMPVVFNTTNDIMKWKPLELNTVDFLYKDEKLYVGGKSGLLEKDTLLPTDTIVKNGQIIECKPFINSGKLYWVFFRFRNDKSKPNYITVYNSTLKTIKNFKELMFV